MTSDAVLRVLIAACLVVVLALMFPRGEEIDVDYKIGAVWVQKDLIAPFSFALLRDEAEYKRDVDDWIRLCAKCHYHFDGLGEKRWKGHVKNSDKECTVVGCTNSVKGRGLCNKHYLKEWRISQYV